MSTFEVPVNTKRAIIENEIRSVCETIYQHEISARVANKIGNTKRFDELTAGLESLEKAKDELNAILKELDQSKAKK